MNKNGNTKMIIAIVAMFVIALSIIGFTYAYFTARINGNTATKSVTVQAGKLEVEYKAGKTINAQGIVPGWISDGKSYFDPTKRDEDGKIVAQHIGAEEESLTNESIQQKIKENETYAKKEYGLIEPADFTVKNSGTNTAYYAIKLTNIQNALEAIGDDDESGNWDDRKHLSVRLYKGTYDITKKLTEKEGDILFNDTLAASNDQQILKVFQIGVNETNHLYLVLEYQNDATHDQSDNMGKAVSVTVEIVGVTRDPNTNTKWIDSSGTVIVDENAENHPAKVLENLGNNGGGE